MRSPQADIAALEAENLQQRARQLAPPPSSDSAPPPLPTVAPPSPAPLAAPEATVGETAAELCVLLGSMAPSQGLASSDELQRCVLSAWGAARRSQQNEIASLRRQLDSAVRLQEAAPAEEDKSLGETLASVSLRLEETERTRKDSIDTDVLWLMAENRTGSEAERLARARALTRETFKCLAAFTAYDDAEEETGDDGKIAVPGEGLVSVGANQRRLRLLERHEAANCVECAARLASPRLASHTSHTHGSVASLIRVRTRWPLAGTDSLAPLSPTKMRWRTRPACRGCSPRLSPTATSAGWSRAGLRW